MRHQPSLSMMTAVPEEEVGVHLTDEGGIPPEALGRHCGTCGEDIVLLLNHGGPAQPGSVQEYRHSATRLVHCVTMFADGAAVSLSDECARACTVAGHRRDAHRVRAGAAVTAARAGGPGRKTLRRWLIRVCVTSFTVALCITGTALARFGWNTAVRPLFTWTAIAATALAWASLLLLLAAEWHRRRRRRR